MFNISDIDFNNLQKNEEQEEVTIKGRSTTLCGRILHPIRNWKLDRQLEQAVMEQFQKQHGVENRKLFQKVWGHVLKERKISWNRSGKLTVGKLIKIDRAFREVMLYHGDGIQAYAEKKGSDSSIQMAVKYLFQGQKLGKVVATKENIKAVFYRHDPKVMLKFQAELANMMRYVKENPQENEMLQEAFVGNILALLPFSYPQTGEQFPVLQKIDGEWKLIECGVERIELTSRKLGSPITAIALTPKENEGRPVLSLIGTTFPAGDGHILTVMSDFTPGMSVGKMPFLMGKKKLQRWFEGKSDVHVVGASLGGALSFHTLNHFHNQIARVDAYSPAGLYPWEYGKKFDHGPQIHIYEQPNDIVPRLGATPEGNNVHVKRVIAFEDGHSEWELPAHARVYAGADKVTVLEVDPKRNNRKLDKGILTALHMMFSWIIFVPMFVALAIQSLKAQTKKRKVTELPA